MILALDLGTTTGWAAYADGQTTSGFISFKNGRYEGGGMRYLKFSRWLTEMGAKEVYFEEVRRHKGTDAAHVYGGFLAAITAWCEANEVPYSGVPVGTIKKHATGKGNAGKDLMIAVANAGGCVTEDDNEADAWCLLQLKLSEILMS